MTSVQGPSAEDAEAGGFPCKVSLTYLGLPWALSRGGRRQVVVTCRGK